MPDTSQIVVSRRVQELRDDDFSTEQLPEELSAFRDTDAWVLLGEPGSGKSCALRMEANAVGGIYLSIAEFIHSDIQAEWQGKILYLDGLDEVRASGHDSSIIQSIRRKLIRLGSPAFRLACRAADWYGSTDKASLKGASPNKKIVVLQLEALTEKNIRKILHDNHHIDDPNGFVNRAEESGLTDLLNNPQMLSLLASAVKDDNWPKNRDETYRLACKQLVSEQNKPHRNAMRKQSRNADELIDAAGQLCAVMLLADKTGIALDLERARDQFPSLEDYAPPNTEAAVQVVGSMLFHPEGEERITPCHRGISEYLAARWLAKRIDGIGLSLQRLLNLLLGDDEGVVAGLRGLYGWLALHCQSARAQLIESDPLTVIFYGDPEPMSTADKRTILKQLSKKSEYPGDLLHQSHTGRSFGALASPELAGDFRRVLSSPKREPSYQTYVYRVLDILAYGDPLPELTSTIYNLVIDDSRWPGINKAALAVWLRLIDSPQLALSLLNGITAGSIQDPDDEMTGLLLRYLYPSHIQPKELLSHLHPPKKTNLLGRYRWFWLHGLPEQVPPDHLPLLLGELIDHPEFLTADSNPHNFNRMGDALLALGLEHYGDKINDRVLFDWLGICADKSGRISRAKESQSFISSWLSAHPDRYKALLNLCFEQSETVDKKPYFLHRYTNRLQGAVPPNDLGVWHLQRASDEDNDELAQLHLEKAVEALSNNQGAAGLSLEKIEAWGDSNPERNHWLSSLLFWEIPEWHVEESARKRGDKLELAKQKTERSKAYTPHLPAIRAGSAHANIMHQLAGVWDNSFSDIQGETPTERFANFCENGSQLMHAAKIGLRRCPKRVDLPSAKEIIALGSKQREHLIRLPCLTGMKLLWLDSPKEIHSLSDDVLTRMIAFHFTEGLGDDREWFKDLVKLKPELVAQVLIPYGSSYLRIDAGHIEGLHELFHDSEYQSLVPMVVPKLLEIFPVQARNRQLDHLSYLLKAALRDTPDQLGAIIEKKLCSKSTKVGQTVYWLAAGMLLDSKNYELKLWDYVGKNPTRINHAANFLGANVSDINTDHDLSANTIGKLIELLSPHAEIERPESGGLVSSAMQRGNHIRALITQLSMQTSTDAGQEISRLLLLPALEKLHYLLEVARHQQKLLQRESAFTFSTPQEVARILANQSPTSAADLMAVALDCLEGVARNIRQENDDAYRAFWNIPAGSIKQNAGQRGENDCRNTLLRHLRARLSPLDIDCQPEGIYSKNKRADIRLSYLSEFELPIEIKRDSNSRLWTAIRDQLINQYSIAPLAVGHGIYLVLWFGGEGMPRTIDGGKKPQSTQELKIRLEAQLTPAEKKRISVRVFDVSWPY